MSRTPGRDRHTTAAAARTRAVSPLNERDWSATVGRITHQVVQDLVRVVPSLSRHQLGEELLERVRTQVREAKINRQPQARGRAVGMAVRYLTGFAAPAGWSVLGTELAVDGGRVDVAWAHADGRVMFDEIKGVRGQHYGLTTGQLAQVTRHCAAGEARFGDRFVGVRVVMVMNTAHSVLVTPGGGLVPLAGSHASPAFLTDEAQAAQEARAAEETRAAGEAA